MLQNIVKLLRPKQATKNLIVFAGPAASGQFLKEDIFFKSSIVLIGFTLAASGVYCMNDALDADSDRNHPIKKHRPIAAGKISKATGLITGLLLILCALLLTQSQSSESAFVVVLYVFLNIFYSLGLKRVGIIEMFIVASGFILRVVSGLVITTGPRTPSFLSVVFFGSLMIVISKRISEKISSEGSRAVLASYDLNFLQVMVGIVASAFIVSYSSFVFGEIGLTWQSLDVFIAMSGIPIVYVTFEIIRLALLGECGEPELLLLKKAKFVCSAVLFSGLFGIYVYF